MLAAGVLAAGVLSDEVVRERRLSLLRERLDEAVGEMGSSGLAMAGSVLMRTPLSFALRRRARSLCSLKRSASVYAGGLEAVSGGEGRVLCIRVHQVAEERAGAGCGASEAGTMGLRALCRVSKLAIGGMRGCKWRRRAK